MGYTSAQKAFGGMGHVVTFGIGAAVGAARGETVWPSFTTGDRWCIACKKPPGSAGCNIVGNPMTVDERDVTVDHRQSIRFV